MQASSHIERSRRGCGFLPPDPAANLRHALPIACDVEPTVCPGYSISLPEVNEVVRFRPSYLKGYLTEHLGEPPSEQFIEAQNVLEGAVNEHHAADIRERNEEAKRRGR